MWIFKHEEDGLISVLDGSRQDMPVAIIHPNNRVEFTADLINLSWREAQEMGDIIRQEIIRRRETREDR